MRAPKRGYVILGCIFILRVEGDPGWRLSVHVKWCSKLEGSDWVKRGWRLVGNWLPCLGSITGTWFACYAYTDETVHLEELWCLQKGYTYTRWWCGEDIFIEEDHVRCRSTGRCGVRGEIHVGAKKAFWSAVEWIGVPSWWTFCAQSHRWRASMEPLESLLGMPANSVHFAFLNSLMQLFQKITIPNLSL